MPLNDRQIRNAKPAEKPYKLSDGGGMYLQVTPAGGRLWRLKYRFDSKEKTLALGKYPDVSLSEARQAAENARRMLAAGQDPSAVKQAAKRERQAALLSTFAHLANDWHKNNLHRWKPNHAARVWRYFETDVLPAIGSLPLEEIRVSNIKEMLDPIAARGSIATADKIRQWVGAVFEYAAMLELTDRNPARALNQYLPKPEKAHMPALPRTELTEFYRRLLLADASRPNKIALMLTMLCFARNTEIRGGQWAEIDFQAAVWVIPAERMKHEKTAPKPPHPIPLSDWAMELLQELHAITGGTPYLFPSRIHTSGYISDNTLGKIIKTLGYKGIATPHGFRSLASSILNEQGYNPDAIERQLAHVEENRIRAAYNRADYMAERREMMQWYSDYLREHYRQALAQIEAA